MQCDKLMVNFVIYSIFPYSILGCLLWFQKDVRLLPVLRSSMRLLAILWEDSMWMSDKQRFLFNIILISWLIVTHVLKITNVEL